MTASSTTVLVKDTEERLAKPIRFLDLKAQFETIRQEVMQAVSKTLESQAFILGREVESFENEFAIWNSSKYAIACASGSDALLLSLMALGVGPGDEVITTAYTFVATIGAIVRLGAKPVFIDIEPDTFNVNAAQLEAAFSPRTKAVIPVHLFGLSADLDPIVRLCEARQIPVIEDAAQAIGARYRGQLVGNMGVTGCFSFFPAKNLGCAGDGGAIATNDGELADRLKVLRTHGSRKRYSYELVGINSRLDALQAAILRIKLPHLNAWTDGRRRNAQRYRELFAERGIDEQTALPVVPDWAHHAYNQFTIRSGRRDALKAYLAECGIPTEVYYPSPLHLQPAFAYLGYQTGDLPESERACREVLSLPIYPELPADSQEVIADAIARFHEV